MSAAVQYDAVRLLQLQQRVQLREQKRQVVLVVDVGAASHDARGRERHHSVHQPLCSLRHPRQRHRRAQPDDIGADMSARLEVSLDRLQLCDGT